MAATEGNLEDYSVYAHLSEEELIQLAVQRSLCDLHPDTDQSTSSSSGFTPPAETNPELRPRNPDPPTHPDPPNVQNCVNPPTGRFSFLYESAKRGVSPLRSLIMSGDAEALLDLSRRSCSSLTAPDDEGWIALHDAAYYGQLQCVRVLVSAHPDSVNRCTLKHQTALLLAAGWGNTSCVDLLLKHGADPNIANVDGETPLIVACEHIKTATVDLLLRSGVQVNRSSVRGGSALDEACRQGQLEICRMLLAAGADVHMKNAYGIRPFFTAVQHGHVDIACLLAASGADINGQAQDGATPLFEACKNGHDDAVDMLISLKANANRCTRSGLLSLHVAVQNNHMRIVSMLIPVSSRLTVQSCGISPLHIAAEKNRDDILELLIESGFDVNAVLSEEHSRRYPDRRRTPLYFSVYNGNLEAAKMLLEAGANVNLDVFNPLLIAVKLGWMEMATLLLGHGADVPHLLSVQSCDVLLDMASLPMFKLLLDHGFDAQPCFDCPYGQNPHPAITPSRHPGETMPISGDTPPHLLFCEVVSSSPLSQVAGPIVSMLLDYVGHVCLCSRLLEVLESRGDWTPIKLKALPPRPLIQLCRLKIRRLIGVQRLKLLHNLPLPVRVIHFLLYREHCPAPPTSDHLTPQ